MIEYNTSSRELIDMAYVAADSANTAHDTMRSIRQDITAVESMVENANRLNIGVIIPEGMVEGLQDEYSEQERDFSCALEVAGCVFVGQPAVAETVEVVELADVISITREPLETAALTTGETHPDVDFGDPVRPVQELRAFSTLWRTATQATRLCNLMLREGLLEEDGTFNIRGLAATVETWIRVPSEYAHIRGMGEKNVRLLADYLKQAVPGLELPEFSTPPKPTKVVEKPKPKKPVPIERMGTKKLRELLLDDVEIDGATAEHVSCRGIIRFAKHAGESQRTVGGYWLVVQSLARVATEGTLPKVKLPSGNEPLTPYIADKRGLAVLGTHQPIGSNNRHVVWGFTPDLFRAVVEGAERNPAIAATLQGYNDTKKAMLTNYLAALRRLKPEL